MHLAGASAIQIGTALLDGMEIFREIKSGVESYLKDKGYSNASDIVGLAWRER
jgi:dihydroorotate dehydrogenase (NAD+) catalytic subunit